MPTGYSYRVFLMLFDVDCAAFPVGIHCGVLRGAGGRPSCRAPVLLTASAAGGISRTRSVADSTAVCWCVGTAVSNDLHRWERGGHLSCCCGSLVRRCCCCLFFCCFRVPGDHAAEMKSRRVQRSFPVHHLLQSDRK
jgi:hypothetical protein